MAVMRTDVASAILTMALTGGRTLEEIANEYFDICFDAYPEEPIDSLFVEE